MKKYSVKIRFEKLKCPLCKHVDNVVIVTVVEAEEGEDKLKEAMVWEVNRKKQDKSMCLKCGFRIKLKKAKKITWRKLREIKDEEKTKRS